MLQWRYGIISVMLSFFFFLKDLKTAEGLYQFIHQCMKRPVTQCSLITGSILEIYCFYRQIMVMPQCHFNLHFYYRGWNFLLLTICSSTSVGCVVISLFTFLLRDVKWKCLCIARLLIFDIKNKDFFPSYLPVSFFWFTFIQPFTLYTVKSIDHFIYESLESSCSIQRSYN